MTVIAACVKNGIAVLAADSQGSVGGVALPGCQKISVHGDVLLGYAGASLFHRVLRKLPGCKAGDEDEFCETVISAVQEFITDKSLEGDEYYCEMLLTSVNGIWLVTSHGDIEKVGSDFWATGSGQEVALGAMWAAAYGTDDAEAIARMGVHAATDLTTTCGGDHVCLSLPQ